MGASTEETMQQLVGNIESMFRKIATEQKEDLEQQYQDRLRDEMASIGMEVVDGELVPLGKASRGLGGLINIQDPCLAREAQILMKETWMPLMVKGVNDKGDITSEAVSEALITFLSGSPFDSGMIASDLNADIILRVMKAAEQKWELDPHARSIVRAIRNYTIGNGFSYSCSVEEVDGVIRDFYHNNRMVPRLREAIASRYICSEHYFFYRSAVRGGDVYVFDSAKPYNIEKIFVHSEDNLRPLAFGRTNPDPSKGSLKWYKDFNFDYLAENFPDIAQSLPEEASGADNKTTVQMTRFNAMGGVRGITDFYSTLRWLKFYEDFVLDRIVLNHERSKVVWIRKIKGSKAIPGGRAQRGPKGGQLLTETDQIEWKTVNAEIHADDVADDGRLIRLCIAAGHGIAEHLLFQDPSNQVYASIRSSDTPFSQNIRFMQQEWESDLELQACYVVRQKVKARKLPAKMTVRKYSLESIDRLRDEFGPAIKEFIRTPNAKIKTEVLDNMKLLVKELDQKEVKIPTDRVSIDFSFGDVVQQDPFKKAQETEVLLRNTIIAGTEAAARHGVKWMEQTNLISMERDTMLDAGLIDSKVLPSASTGKGTQSLPSANDPKGSKAPSDKKDNPPGDGQ